MWFLRLPRDWLLPSLPPRLYRYRAAARHAGLSLLRFSLLLLSLLSAAPPSGEEELEIPQPVYSKIEREGDEERSPSGALPLIVFALAFKTF